MCSQNDESMVADYKDVYGYLEARGHKPQLNVTDNKCSTVVYNYMTTQNVDWQLMEPNNHQVNDVEHVIRTFTHHFLARLATINSIFPIQLWYHLLLQTELTLNLIRQSTLDPDMST